MVAEGWRRRAGDGGDRCTSSSSSVVPRTPPSCARCRNHRIKIELKGHKRYCKYKHCKCEKCLSTATRQQVMARNTAQRRAQQQDEARARAYVQPPPGVELEYPDSPEVKQPQSPAFSAPPPPPRSTGSRSEDSVPNSPRVSSSYMPAPVNLAPPPPLPLPPLGPLIPQPHSAISLDLLVENCNKLLEKFHYTWEMMPLVLVIMNYAGSDIEEASRMIDEAYWVLYKRSLSSLLLNNGALCCAPASYRRAPEYMSHLLPLQLTTQSRLSPPPAHL